MDAWFRTERCSVPFRVEWKGGWIEVGVTGVQGDKAHRVRIWAGIPPSVWRQAEACHIVDGGGVQFSGLAGIGKLICPNGRDDKAGREGNRQPDGLVCHEPHLLSLPRGFMLMGIV